MWIKPGLTVVNQSNLVLSRCGFVEDLLPVCKPRSTISVCVIHGGTVTELGFTGLVRL